MRKVILLAFVAALLFSCTKDEMTYEDGAYKAVEAEFVHGWKAYLNISIVEDALTTVEFDYLDEDGNKKSETTAESYPMVPHPSTWIPQYESTLISTEIVEYAEIDAVTGATNAGTAINKLMNAALEAAKTGDTSEQVITD